MNSTKLSIWSGVNWGDDHDRTEQRRKSAMLAKSVEWWRNLPASAKFEDLCNCGVAIGAVARTLVSRVRPAQYRGQTSGRSRPAGPAPGALLPKRTRFKRSRPFDRCVRLWRIEYLTGVQNI
jgi:hypothetical protein